MRTFKIQLSRAQEMRRIAKKQVDLEQREQFDMMISGGGGAGGGGTGNHQYDMRNCNGGYLDDYEVFKNGPFHR